MNYKDLFVQELHRIDDANTYKFETPFTSPQAGIVTVNGKKVVMMASNNYLGMSNHPVVKKAAIEGIKEFGYGMASVRFLCGTQSIHLELEKKIAKFVGTEDSILFSSAFAANNAFFPSLFNEKLGYENYRDVIYTDGLNHASIIDGMRLCKSETTDKKIYRNNDIAQLEQLLEADKNADYRFRIIAT
ncbi:MAG: aminotransferase class I/II-fold pyridoxal phosphate-dependent enzyme, partial [Bacteroidota bacterium]|nr:aminotransferase class I/II-fold pyridoxal phosphate-dependent enzyme [Bacteroidota bacterium]